MPPPIELSSPSAICPLCSGRLELVLAVPYLRLPGMCQFVACQQCETTFDAARLFDPEYIGSNTQYSASDIKFYVEYVAGIEYFAMLIGILKHVLAHAPQPVQRPRFLDIGTAFGFAVSIASSCGWDSIGIEPSRFGAIGSELLAVPIISDYVGNADLEAHSFDCIVIADVIEHVAQPAELITSALRLLKPNGVLLITTPNSEVITQHLEPDVTDVLSPGYHLTIFSPKGLSTVLAGTSISETRFFFQGGASGRKSMTVLASGAAGILPHDLPWQQIAEEANLLAEGYLSQLVTQKEHAVQTDMLYGGALFRLLEKRMLQRDYVRAADIQQKLAALAAKHAHTDWSEERLNALALMDFPDLVQAVPAYTGLFHYYSGVLKLEHQNEVRAASREFYIAKRLFIAEKSTQIFPRISWPEKACYYQACALLQAGQPKEALSAFQELIDAPKDVPAEYWEQIHTSKATAHMRLSQYPSAIQSLLPVLRMRIAKVSSKLRSTR